MGEKVQIGVVVVSIGILLLISIPGLIWLRQWMFRDEDTEH